ncbi:MAG: DNA polymerase I [Ilumatobacteraceae bacterium]|nr:DNA polymerase I [Ilumatobacteraceae bacterium]
MQILALDGNSLTYRAFFALPEDMATASGQTTNAVYGFTTMLMSLVKEHRPDGVVVAFDRPEPTFRHEAIPEYKAQREKAPETLRQQMGLVRELLDVLGIRWIEAPGFEGDDIIATIADRAETQGVDVIVVTGDRDTYQLVKDPHVRVLYNKRGVSDYALYDEAGIYERTGVTPVQYPEYAALRGDSSDNLDGIPGVGEKTAAKLIAQYGSVDAAVSHAAEQTPKIRAGLEEHGGRVSRNARMMYLRRDVPLELDLNVLQPCPDLASARRLFDFLEFKNMYKRVSDIVGQLGWATRGESPADASVERRGGTRADAQVRTAADTKEIVKVLQSLTSVTFAARWSGRAGASDLFGLAVLLDAESGEVLWIDQSQLGDVKVREALSSVPRSMAHDAKSFMRWMEEQGTRLDSLVLDTAIAAYLLNPSLSSYDFVDVCRAELALEVEDAKGASGQLDFGDGPSVADSAAREAFVVSQLAASLQSSLNSSSVESLYHDVENPLVGVLARMEATGIGVDLEKLQAIRDRLTGEVENLATALHKVAGREFNLNSPMQLREILFDQKGLTPGKKTKTGYSTDAATLEKIRDQWPEFIDPLMRFREIEKLRSTYGEGLLAEVAPDGRIHATFNQTVARTGRLSSDHPNLHNIPVRSEEGRVFRQAFVPATGREFLVADYNQIELRCIAHLANDPGLVAAFTAGEDIHTATASRVFGVNPKKVTIDQRSQAKMVSYGLAYGMEAYGLSQRLSIGVDEAAGILEAYFAAFPAVKAYMEETVNDARRNGFTETLFGRRRPIPELRSDNFRVRQAGERQAMNAGIQGLAADIFKIALVRIDHALANENLESRLVLQVHDEVIIESPTKEKPHVEEMVLDIMKTAAVLNVPLEVNFSWGASWAEAK